MCDRLSAGSQKPVFTGVAGHRNGDRQRRGHTLTGWRNGQGTDRWAVHTLQHTECVASPLLKRPPVGAMHASPPLVVLQEGFTSVSDMTVLDVTSSDKVRGEKRKQGAGSSRSSPKQKWRPR